MITLSYLSLAPQILWLQLIFFSLPTCLNFLIKSNLDDSRQPKNNAHAASALYEIIPFFHFVLHFSNLFLAAHMFCVHGFMTTQSAIGFWLILQASSLSGPIVGHELIHRRSHRMRWIGRLLLATILYEHFFVEHIRGHHRNVGLKEDLATAYFNESYMQFLKRSVLGQFMHAWELENTRLKKMSGGINLFKHQVFQGVIVEVLLMLTFYIMWKLNGLIFFMAHAIIMHFMAQTFNYLLHWGLERTEKQKPSDPSLSWDCNDTNVIFSMLAISRHAYHHANPQKHFHAIRYSKESPKLPHNIIKMFWLAIAQNKRYIRIMTKQLEKYDRLPVNPEIDF